MNWNRTQVKSEIDETNINGRLRRNQNKIDYLLRNAKCDLVDRELRLSPSWADFRQFPNG